MKVAIIGAGFYGIMAALELRKIPGIREVVVYDKTSCILSGAGKFNQARVHQGYHYPRSNETIEQSKHGSVSYQNEFMDAIQDIKHNVYITREDGLVKPNDYLETMRAHQLKFTEVNMSRSPFRYRDDGVKYSAIEVSEKYINCERLEKLLLRQLKENEIKFIFNSEVLDIDPKTGSVKSIKDGTQHYDAIINCTFTDPLMGYNPTKINFKYEFCMMLLIASDEIRDCALTIMDGEFVSIYPWLPGLHTVSSVKYTPGWKFGTVEEFKFSVPQITHKELQAQAHLIERHMNEFVDMNYTKVSYITAPKIKIVNDTDDQRLVQTFVKDKCFAVLPGKLDAVGIFLDELKVYIKTRL